MAEMDPLAILMMQNLSGGPDYNRPMFPDSFGQTMSNLGHGLAWYGGENLKRQLGIPYQDPTALALARAKLLEEIEQAQLRRQATAPFAGDLSRVFEPEVRREYFPTGSYDEMTDEPQFTKFENRTYTPQQKMAARVRFGINLEDTTPEARTRAEETATWHRSLREQMAAKRGNEREALRLREEAAGQRADESALRFRLQAQSSLQKVYDHGMKEEYTPQEIEAAASKAIDAKTGELDLNKLYRSMPPGQSPRTKRIKLEHEQKIKIAEQRMKIMRERARDLAKQHGDMDGFRRFNAAARQWEQQFKAFAGDLSTIGQPFTMPPPDPEDYIGLSFQPGGGVPGTNNPNMSPRRTDRIGNPTLRQMPDRRSPVDEAANTPDLDDVVNDMIFGSTGRPQRIK